MDTVLPAIPAKRYFTIGEVSELCGVKAYVLRYWEQEFTQLRPMKRRGNRRYYQHHEVLLIRRIRELLYDQGFTISGARNRLAEATASGRGGSFAAARKAAGAFDRSTQETQEADSQPDAWGVEATNDGPTENPESGQGGSAASRPEIDDAGFILTELRAIRALLSD
ncbi:MAG: MerR family transcriptional regulator [Betaproteobacteria bacterium]